MVAYCVPAMLWLATNTTHVTVRLAGAISAYRQTPLDITDEQWFDLARFADSGNENPSWGTRFCFWFLKRKSFSSSANATYSKNCHHWNIFSMRWYQPVKVEKPRTLGFTSFRKFSFVPELWLGPLLKLGTGIDPKVCTSSCTCTIRERSLACEIV